MLSALTIDIGTTGVKLCLFDADGELVASHRTPTPTVADAGAHGVGEIYDIDALLAVITGFVDSLDDAQRGTVQRIAVTGVGESGGLVRPDTSLASPMILWHDHRGAAYLERLSPADRTRIYGVTGLPVNANYGISKAAWAVAQAQDAAASASAPVDAQWLNISEYVAARLTGVRWSELSLASRTMALDLRTRTWSPEVCALFGLTVDTFPALRPATHGEPILGDVARSLGLPEGVRVHIAGHDHMVGGTGADLAPGELLNSTGTTEGLLFLVAQPVLDAHAEASRLANGVAPDGRDATLFASIPTGGSAFETLQGMLGLDEAELVRRVDALAARWEAGDIDLARIPLVLPRFRGASLPTKDSAARGLIAGLGHDTTADEIVFGTFLGLVLQFADVLELFRIRPDRVKVIGPASRNPLWLQLKADVLGAPLSVSGFGEVVSRGAQSLASGESVAWAASAPRDVLPDAARHARLAGWLHGIRPLWEHLKGAPTITAASFAGPARQNQEER